MKNWYIYSKKADFYEIGKRFDISPMLARILRNRDITEDKDIDEYLHGDVSFMHDASLLDDADKACRIIRCAIKEKEKICIMGDYDIDGVCASHILKTVLLSFGADVYISIPNRVSDGYGMNSDMVCDAYDENVGLIITCDNGIKAHEAVSKAKEMGIKVIITDHHDVPEHLPEADVVIDPHIEGSRYPFKDLCGAAVAYKLMQVLCGNDMDIMDDLLLFAGFATIGDIVPLKGENRIFAKEGLKRLRKCKNKGLNALIDIKNIEKEKIEAYHIGFILGPCINSAGRLKDASLVTELLECDDDIKAKEIADKLSRLNDERKDITEKSALKAELIVKDKMLKQKVPDKVIAIYLPDAHESIAGIVASRLKEKFYRPAFVITDSQKGLKGSGRSIEAYNMIKEVSKHQEFFEKLGGHAMACGFTLKEGCLDDFIYTINAECMLTEDDLTDKLWIDMQLPFEVISEDFINELELIKPYGASNPKPVFAEKDIILIDHKIIGKNKNVLKMILQSRNGLKITGIMFGNEQTIAERNIMLNENIKKRTDALKIACIYYPEINIYKDMKSIQIIITDFDISK